MYTNTQLERWNLNVLCIIFNGEGLHQKIDHKGLGSLFSTQKVIEQGTGVLIKFQPNLHQKCVEKGCGFNNKLLMRKFASQKGMWGARLVISDF